MHNGGRLTLTGLVLGGLAITIACNSGNSDTSSSGDAGGNDIDATPSQDDGSVPPQTDGSTQSDGSAGKDSGVTTCKVAADCPSKVCLPNGTCAAATCTDGVQNEDETDIDCGGAKCGACDTMKKCKTGTDCTSKVCTDTGSGLECQAPTDSDGVQNGTETDIDCGGGNGTPACADTKDCKVRSDCLSDVCSGGKCITPVCNDGIKNGTETGIDCGGASCPRCADEQGCVTGGDCIDGVCADIGDGNGVVCQPPTYTDGVKNGTETDVDCGGTGDPTNHACPATDMCLVDTDCTSDGCDYTKHCAIKRSCAGNNTGGHYGADTCGTGGAGGVGAANWESCCATVPVTASEITQTSAGKAVNVTVQMSKYKVTAGRMRQFLESIDYDVYDFVQTARAGGQVPVLPVPDPTKTNTQAPSLLPPAWDVYLPTSLTGDAAETPTCDQGTWDENTKSCTGGTYAPMFTAAQLHVGPTIFKANSQTLQGCDYGSPGTHIYYLGAKDYYGASADFDQTIYDQKPIQCVDYVVAQAFCIWDGGRLETTQEWYAAYGSTSGVGTEAAPILPWTPTGQTDSRGLANLIPKSDLPTASNSPPASVPNVHNCVANAKDAYCATGTCGATGTCAPLATYTACRFPTATDTLLNNAGYIGMTGCADWTVPDTAHSIEMAVYQYNYEWPQLLNSDFSVFISPPGRTVGRSAAGVADITGLEFEISSNLTAYTDNPFPYETATACTTNANCAAGQACDVANTTTACSAGKTCTCVFDGAKVAWSGNGSWEVHNFSHGTGGNGSYRILDKYGKMGLRCVY